MLGRAGALPLLRLVARRRTCASGPPAHRRNRQKTARSGAQRRWRLCGKSDRGVGVARAPHLLTDSRVIWAKGPSCISQGHRPWHRALYEHFKPQRGDLTHQHKARSSDTYCSPYGATGGRRPREETDRPGGACEGLALDRSEGRCPWLSQVGPLAHNKPRISSDAGFGGSKDQRPDARLERYHARSFRLKPDPTRSHCRPAGED